MSLIAASHTTIGKCLYAVCLRIAFSKAHTVLQKEMPCWPDIPQHSFATIAEALLIAFTMPIIAFYISQLSSGFALTASRTGIAFADVELISFSR